MVCPSLDDARKVILNNYDHLFADLAAHGVQLAALCPGPYDYGGCLCDRCQPWILTYAQLCYEIHAICKRYHPDVQMQMIGWWWQPAEHEQFAQWVDREHPGWVTRMYLHIPYGKTSTADVRLPRGCRRAAFVHIGYADQPSPRDVYGHLGPVVAPQRLPRTVTDLQAQNVSAVMAYSEGVFDDANKALLAGLGSGKYRTADEVLREYARRYFQTTPANAEQWSRWLQQWGRPFTVDTKAARRDLSPLPEENRVGNWRWRQWQLKVELISLNERIGSSANWTADRLRLVDDFLAVHEMLHRHVWGLGPERHVLNINFAPLPWYRGWKARDVPRK